MTPKCYSYIRFSTPEQIKGDSLRRQLKMSEDYAREKGLELDQSMRDLGVSAFKGLQRTKGALGRFLVLVKDGKIPKGSTLIVESLDRLSRQQIQPALRQFLEITGAGIRIVTLTDRMEYDEQSDVGQLIISLTIMSRANEESAIKAKRLKSAWDGKRDAIAYKKMTARAPAWLTLSNDKAQFSPIPERTEIINRIYRERLTGLGSELIARGLNLQQAWTPKSGWRKSYVEKILHSSAVIGEYQPHQMIDSKRVPIGDSISDYYPKVVAEDLYFAVRQQMEQRASLSRGNGGGRTGAINNLFGHIAKCGYCGGAMALLNKGKLNYRYLVCDTARRGMPGCKRHFLRYDEFEELVLTYCKGLNPADLLPGHEEQETALKVLQGQLLTVQGKGSQAAAKVDNLSDTIATTNSAIVRQTLEKKLDEALKEQTEHEAEAKQLSKEIKRQSTTNEVTGTQLASMRELLTFLQERKGEELIEVRRRLREELRGLIERIDVYPVGRILMTPERTEHAVKEIIDSFPDVDENWFRTRFESMIDNKNLRRFAIYFKGGSIREIVPATDEKLMMEFDREGGRVLSLSEGVDGKTVW